MESKIKTLGFFKEARNFHLSQNILKIKKISTVPSHNKQTHNKNFSHNKHAFFALTKMCLFGEEEDFKKFSRK